MEDRKIKTHKFSKAKLQNLVSESVCRTLRFDILNLEHDTEEFKDILNHDCRILEHKEWVERYVNIHAEDIGDILRRTILNLFSHEELEEAYLSTDYTEIYKKLNEYYKKMSNKGYSTHYVVLSMMLEYRVESYIQEEIHRADY